MKKTKFKPGNMLYPLPAVMVSCGDIHGISNILTIAWTGTLCTNPPMAYIAVRPERHSYNIIRNSGEFVINLTTKKLIRATDFCGVRSGKDHNKWSDCHLTPMAADTVKCPLIKESPVNIECKVSQVLELGSHHVFIADVTAVHVDDRFLDKNGTFHLEDADLIAYSHGTYFDLGKPLGNFGFSVRKKTLGRRPAPGKKGSKSKSAAYDK
jgi:flavin reductase (DIM6/NTAB) family NADH-FMN oxidoreductase RutF